MQQRFSAREAARWMFAPRVGVAKTLKREDGKPGWDSADPSKFSAAFRVVLSGDKVAFKQLTTSILLGAHFSMDFLV
jgi:hypothetical protein